MASFLIQIVMVKMHLYGRWLWIFTSAKLFPPAVNSNFSWVPWWRVFIFPNATGLKPFHQMQFSVIYMTLFVVLTLGRNAVGVFYSPTHCCSCFSRLTGFCLLQLKCIDYGFIHWKNSACSWNLVYPFALLLPVSVGVSEQ